MTTPASGSRQVAQLHARGGYGALLFDFSGHGQSEGNQVTYGIRERQDVTAAIEYLRQRGDVDMDQLAILGNSLGAITAVMAAVEHPDLRAVVIESGFSDLYHDIAKIFTRYTGLPSFPFAHLVIFWGQRIAHVRLSEIRPAQVIGGIAPRPVLIISDLRDGLADEPYDGEHLYQAAGEPQGTVAGRRSHPCQCVWRRACGMDRPMWATSSIRILPCPSGNTSRQSRCWRTAATKRCHVMRLSTRQARILMY